MTIGSTMPMVTMMDAGATADAALHPDAPARAAGTAVMIASPRPVRESALERLVPPLLERNVVLREVPVIEIDQALAFLGVEADALFGFGRNPGVANRGVVAHVFGEGFLRRGLEHLVRRVLRDHEARDVQRYPLLRRHGLHLRAGLLPLHGARLPHDADAHFLVL